MPFLNTSPATGGSGVLGSENRVSSHGRLFSIVFWILWSYSGFNKINSVLPDCIDTFALDILPVFSGEFEFGSEFGSIQGCEGLGDLTVLEHLICNN